MHGFASIDDAPAKIDAWRWDDHAPHPPRARKELRPRASARRAMEKASGLTFRVDRDTRVFQAIPFSNIH